MAHAIPLPLPKTACSAEGYTRPFANAFRAFIDGKTGRRECMAGSRGSTQGVIQV